MLAFLLDDRPRGWPLLAFDCYLSAISILAVWLLLRGSRKNVGACVLISGLTAYFALATFIPVKPDRAQLGVPFSWSLILLVWATALLPAFATILGYVGASKFEAAIFAPRTVLARCLYGIIGVLAAAAATHYATESSPSNGAIVPERSHAVLWAALSVVSLARSFQKR